VILAAAVLLPAHVFPLDEEEARLEELLRYMKNPPKEEYPTQEIYLKNGFLYCTGDSTAAVENNKACELMEKGDFKSAAKVLKEGLKNSALFFPFQYNIGMCYLYRDRLKRALNHFNKARQIVPEFSKTYLQMGYIYDRMNLDNNAIYYFREGIKHNVKELETFVMIGDIFFKRHQLEMAQKYYNAALSVDYRLPNGILGMAKIQFKRGNYIKAIVLLKGIDTAKKEYDKALHYYYAESAFKLRDYKTAAEQYTILLKHRNDRFFLTNSPALIEHKLNLSNRFAEF